MAMMAWRHSTTLSPGPTVLLPIHHSNACRPTAVLPLKPARCGRIPARRPRRAARVTAQDSSNQQQSQQQQLNLSVLRFTLGIPGLDESYLPRYIGVAFGSLVVLNHFLSTASPTPAQLRSEALGVCLAAFSAALPYLGKFLKGSNPVDRSPLPEGNKQIFLLSEDISDALKEDLAWASYVLLRNTNTMSVLIVLQDALCIRGYWRIPEDVSKADMIGWFRSQIKQLGFLELKETLYFPQISDSQFNGLLPSGTRSLLVHQVIGSADENKNLATSFMGFVVLSSNANYAYSDRDRGWIGALANKFKVIHPNVAKVKS